MSAARRLVCVVTGSRADYGLLYWSLREIVDDPVLELQLAVTGTHLSSAFGMTYRQIEADGFPIAAKIDMELENDSVLAVGQAMGLAVNGFADALHRLQPDLMVVLGAHQAPLLQKVMAVQQRGDHLLIGDLVEYLLSVTALGRIAES